MYYVMLPRQEMYDMLRLKQNIENASWVDGVPFLQPLPLLEFFVEINDPFTWCDYFRPAANIPLFSGQMKSWLDSVGVDNIDYYDAVVTNMVTEESRSYHAANIIGQVLCMDTEKSEYTLFDEDYYMAEDIQRLVLDESKLLDTRICRLAEFDLLVFVHEEVKSVLTASGCVGVEFVEPEDWDGFSS